MLRRWVELVIKRPLLTIFIIFALTAVLAVGLKDVQIRLEPDAQIPPGHPLVKIGQKIEKEFGGKYVSAIMVYPKKGNVYNQKIFRKLKTITEKANKLAGLRPNGVVSIVADNVRDIRGSVTGLEVKPYVEDIPTTEEEFAALRERVEHNRSVTAMMINKDATAASVLIDFADFEAAGGAAGCYLSMEKIAAPERDAETDVTVTGTPSLIYWFLLYTDRVSYIFALTLFMIGLLQYRTFRTFQGMLIPIVTALLGVIWAMGMVGWTGSAVDPWNSMTPILVLAIAAGHSTQILKRYYEEYNRVREANPGLSPREANREAVIESTVRVGSVMMAAGGIASISFASLVTFDMPSVQSFGKAVAFGIAASLLIEMTFIPALRSMLPAPSESDTNKEKGRTLFDPMLYGISASIRGRRDRWILVASAALLVVAAAGAMRMEANNSMAAQFFSGPDIVHRLRGGSEKELSFLDAARKAEEKTAGPYTVSIRVETPEPDGMKDPAVLRAMERLQKFIQDRADKYAVGNALSLVDFLKLMNRSLHGDDPEFEVLPDTREAVAQLLLLYSMSGPGGDIERFVDFDYQRAVMTLYLRTDDDNIVSGLVKSVQAEIPKLFKGTGATVEVGGGIAYLLALNEVVVRDKILNMVQIMSIIFVVTSLLLRSFMGGLMVLVPLISSITINFGIMGWFGVWLSMGTAAISAMAAGIGADYAIYFIFRMREEIVRTGDRRESAAITLVTSGKAIVSVALAIGTGYLCIPLSGFKMHFMLGVLVALMMMSSCLGAVALMPAVLVRIKARFLERASPQKAGRS
jgi:predicted RND superfamily exporter protein